MISNQKKARRAGKINHPPFCLVSQFPTLFVCLFVCLFVRRGDCALHSAPGGNLPRCPKCGANYWWPQSGAEDGRSFSHDQERHSVRSQSLHTVKRANAAGIAHVNALFRCLSSFGRAQGREIGVGRNWNESLQTNETSFRAQDIFSVLFARWRSEFGDTQRLELNRPFRVRPHSSSIQERTRVRRILDK